MSVRNTLTLDEPPKKPSPTQLRKPAIDRLKPGSDLHSKVLTYLTDRLRFSQRNMRRFYERWRENERRTQGYIDLRSAEQVLKEQTDKGRPANPVSITIPYNYATLATITTYLTHP